MIGIYAFAHFAVDLGCAFAVFSAFDGRPLGFLLYNFFAFALQMPLGLLTDHLGKSRLLAFFGTGLVGILCCFPAFGLVGTCLLGLGNAMFHIGSGVDVLKLSHDRAAPLGVFVSPGAFGIFLGTLLGKAHASGLFVLLTLSAAVLLLGVVHRPVPKPAPVSLPSLKVLPWAVLLFLVVVLRSVSGMLGSFSWKTGLWSWAAVGAVVVGKALGGVCADRFGVVRTAALSLSMSAVLFLFGENPLCGTAALLLFNMTMPLTLHLLAQHMPGCKGFSFGLLTFALFLGFLPAYLSMPSIGTVAMAAISILSLLLLLPAGIRP